MRLKQSLSYLLMLSLVACFSVVALPQSGEPAVTPLLRCWSRPAAVSAGAGIAVDSDTAYFVTNKSTLNAVDIKTGEIVWSSEVGGAIDTPLLSSGNAVYTISSDPAKQKLTAVIRAINRVSGITNWSVELTYAEQYHLGETNAGITIVASNGTIQTLRASDGSYVWKTLFTGQLSAQPEVSNGAVTVGVSGKRIEVFKPLEAKLSLKLKSDSAVLVRNLKNVTVYSDDRGEVFSIDTSDGGRNWNFKAGGKVGDITPFGNKVLVSSADNFVYHMSLDDGNVLWKRRMPGRIAKVVTTANDQALVTVIGERSAFVLEMDKGKIVNQISLEGEDLFLTTPIKANGTYLIAATVSGVSAYSTACVAQKSGK